MSKPLFWTTWMLGPTSIGKVRYLRDQKYRTEWPPKHFHELQFLQQRTPQICLSQWLHSRSAPHPTGRIMPPSVRDSGTRSGWARNAPSRWRTYDECPSPRLDAWTSTSYLRDTWRLVVSRCVLMVFCLTAKEGCIVHRSFFSKVMKARLEDWDQILET